MRGVKHYELQVANRAQPSGCQNCCRCSLKTAMQERERMKPCKKDRHARKRENEWQMKVMCEHMESLMELIRTGLM